jgi:hypothetical protein
MIARPRSLLRWSYGAVGGWAALECAGGAPCDAGLGEEPLIRNADASRAALKRTTVTIRRRFGVSHRELLRPSHARVPLAAAMLPMALIMHCMHMSIVTSL